MSKNPDAKNLLEYTGVIELKPNQFERVSGGIREAKSYLALAGNTLTKSLDKQGPAPTDFVRSVIGHLSENLSIAGEQAINLNPEATTGLDILKWVSDHGSSEASGVISTGPLSATAWLNRQVQSIEVQKGYSDGSVYLTAWHRAQMRLLLSKDSIGAETFHVDEATVYSPRHIHTEIRRVNDGALSLTNTASGSKFAPRVKHLTHHGQPGREELAPTKATVAILPNTTITISDLDKRPSGDAKWGAEWLEFLGDRSATEKLTRSQFPVITSDENCSFGPIKLLNKKTRRSLEVEVEQLGQFPHYEGGISINVKAGKKLQEIKFRPSDLPATIFLPGENFAKSSGTTTAETAKLLDRQLESFAQALLDMTEAEVVNK